MPDGFTYKRLPNVGSYANSYLITDKKSGISAVIDAGSPYEEAVVSGGGNIEFILLTHGHFDHMIFLREYIAAGVKICIHENDESYMSDAEKNCSNMFMLRGDSFGSADIIFRGEHDKFTLGSTKITVLHTPGHTPGSVCYIAEDVIFSGDTLFAGTAGRCDFPGGNAHAIVQSLRTLRDLEGQYVVLPGHEDETDLDTERKSNFYMRG